MLDRDKVMPVGKNVLTEFGGERCEALDDCGEPRLGFVRKAAAIAQKGDMIALENPCLFGIKPDFAAARIKRVDALKHRTVQVDSAAMPGKFWRDLAFDRFEFVIGVGAGQIEENRTDPGKLAAASFERFDRVFEGRRFWIGRDCSGLGLRVGKRDLEGLPKVAWLRRHAKRPRPRFEKRVRRAGCVLVHAGFVQFLRQHPF